MSNGSILVTGATGAVGHHIARRLLATDHAVRVLVRDPERAAKDLPPGCTVVRGDVTDAASVDAAVEGTTKVFHAAGLPEQWLEDTGTFERVNVGGTHNVANAAAKAGARLVYTSTIDVFEARPGEHFDESRLASQPKPTAYERSKQEADRVVAAAVAKGLDAVFVHPAAVYGPAPDRSPGVNDFIARLIRRELPALLPGSLPLVLARDAGEGHVLAGERGTAGERFILCETAVTLGELAELTSRFVPRLRLPATLPVAAARGLAIVGDFVSRWTRRPPLVPRGQFEFTQWHARPVSQRARERLGWTCTPLSAGIQATLDHLVAVGRIPAYRQG